MPTPFSFPACIVSIATTSLGLIAAALAIKWGNPPPPGDALLLAWVYVQIMLALLWLLVWPALALRPARIGVANTHLRLLSEATLFAMGAMPAAGLSAFLSRVSLPMVAEMAALQAGLAFFSAGLLAFAGGSSASSRRAPRVMLALSTLTLAGPIFAFLVANFFPTLPHTWSAYLPLIAITHAAYSLNTWSAIPSHTWWTAAAYALIGAGAWLKTSTEEHAGR